MKALLLSVLFAVSWCQPPASPVHNSFKIPLIRQPLSESQRKSLFHSLFSSLSSKYKSFLSETIESTLPTSLENFDNSEYVGLIGVGSPPQPLKVIFDTGSANFFINSKLCESLSCQSRDFYDHDLSSDYSPNGASLYVRFGSGEIRGVMAQDTLNIAGVDIPQQDLAEVTEEIGSVFLDCHFSGLMGLAFQKLAKEGTVPVFENIDKSGKLAWNVFSFFYSLEEDENSELLIGDIDPDKFEAPIHWVPLTQDPSYWTVIIDDIRFGDQSLGICESGCYAAVDTGTSLISAPSSQLRVIEEKFDYSKCSEISELPDLVYVIDGKDYVLKPEVYVEEKEEFDEEFVERLGVRKCGPAFMEINVMYEGNALFVLGDLFLSQYYSVFDKDNMAVGLAKAKHKSSKAKKHKQKAD